MEAEDFLATCHRKSCELLLRNLAPTGILAATVNERSEERGYTAIFGRDAAICALGMALSGNAELRDAAATGLLTLAQHQAPNGQMPKFVDVRREEADFWYLGCIDSTLWWLIAIAFLDGPPVGKPPAEEAAAPRHPSDKLRSGGALAARFAPQIRLALQWLLAQEHQRFFLLQQNEASDWADIMPRSGFVLYTNALWFYVKRLYALPRAAETRENCNGIFHPFSAQLAEYRRGRLLADYALQKARNRELYLSFVNFSFFGDEGDVFGNVLAVLMGIAGDAATRRTLRALRTARVHDPYPVRTVCEPIPEDSFLWRPYMARHEQNFAWQYHNGGIWPMVGGFWVSALVDAGQRDEARGELVKMARACALNDWEFNEWLHGQNLEPRGMPGQSWNAAAFLFAAHAVDTGTRVFAQTAASCGA